MKKLYLLFLIISLCASCQNEDSSPNYDDHARIGLVEQLEHVNESYSNSSYNSTRGIQSYFKKLKDAVSADFRGYFEALQDASDLSVTDFLPGDPANGIPNGRIGNALNASALRSAEIFKGYQIQNNDLQDLTLEEEYAIVENANLSIVSNPSIVENCVSIDVNVPSQYKQPSIMIAKMHNYDLDCCLDITNPYRSTILRSVSAQEEMKRTSIIEALRQSQIIDINPVTTLDSLYCLFIQSIEISIYGNYDINEFIMRYSDAIEETSGISEIEKRHFYNAMSISLYSKEFWSNFISSHIAIDVNE